MCHSRLSKSGNWKSSLSNILFCTIMGHFIVPICFSNENYHFFQHFWVEGCTTMGRFFVPLSISDKTFLFLQSSLGLGLANLKWLLKNIFFCTIMRHLIVPLCFSNWKPPIFPTILSSVMLKIENCRKLKWSEKKLCVP